LGLSSFGGANSSSQWGHRNINSLSITNKHQKTIFLRNSIFKASSHRRPTNPCSAEKLHTMANENIVYPKYLGDVHTVVTHGYLGYAQNCDFLNPGKCLTGPQITEGYLSTLYIKCMQGKDMVNDGFPITWTLRKKKQFMLNVEAQVRR